MSLVLEGPWEWSFVMFFDDCGKRKTGPEPMILPLQEFHEMFSKMEGVIYLSYYIFFSWMKLCINEVQFFFFVLSGMLKDKFFCDQSNRYIWKELLKEGAQEKKYAGVGNSIGKLFYLDSVYSDMTSLPYKLPLKLYIAICFSILRKAHAHHFSQLRTFSLPSSKKPCRT